MISKDFKTEEDISKWIEIIHSQNLNGRESHEEAFILGIEAALSELIELGLLTFPCKEGQKEQVNCNHTYINDGVMQGESMKRCLNCGNYRLPFQ